MNETLLSARLGLFPQSTTIENIGGASVLSIAGNLLTDLAERFGTPLYLYDRLTLDESVQAYRQALAKTYPAESGITYAGKAFLCLGIAQWAQHAGLWLDCTGAGEIYIARAAGVPRSSILVHGVNKSAADLGAALAQAGTLVVDNLAELDHLVLCDRSNHPPLPDLWLRLRPGMAVDTHAHRQTGQEDSKFGMSPGEIQQAVQVCLDNNLPVNGLHLHQGSHFHDLAPLGQALDVVLELISTIRNRTGWLPRVLCPGGGWGVAYHESELPQPPTGEYVQYIASHLVEGCRQRQLPLPKLQLEPGRSLVARAGVALYRVGAVKQTASRRWLLIDGGLADNPRPALYGARYSALPVSDPGRPLAGPATLGGPYCESGDVLIRDLPLPDIQPGELIAVPVSGAYQLSMGSNYNGARRPAVVWLEAGAARLIQRRETLEELTRRDLPLQELETA